MQLRTDERRKIMFIGMDDSNRIEAMYEMNADRHTFKWWYGQIRHDHVRHILTSSDNLSCNGRYKAVNQSPFGPTYIEEVKP